MYCVSSCYVYIYVVYYIYICCNAVDASGQRCQQNKPAGRRRWVGQGRSAAARWVRERCCAQQLRSRALYIYIYIYICVCFALQAMLAAKGANNKKPQATTACWPREKRGCASVFAVHLPGTHIHLLKKKGEPKESPQVGHSFVSRSNWTFKRSGLAYLIRYVCNCNACYVARAKCSERASHSARPYSFWFVYIPRTHGVGVRVCVCVCVCVCARACVCVRASAMHAGVAANMVPVRCIYPLPLNRPNRGR